MTCARSPFRFVAAVLAVVAGLGWVAPVGYGACPSMGPSAPMHCDGAMSAQHCGVDPEASAEACAVHHAREDATTAQGPSIDPPVAGRPAGGVHSAVPVATASFLRNSIRRAVSLALLRARVGVWLE